jgi:dienelactone hydrolase
MEHSLQPTTQLDSHSSVVDGIPVLWIEPSGGAVGQRLALWLPYLSGTKESVAPFLGRLAEAGFLAVSFDFLGHGERSTETSEQLMSRVFGEFRTNMWPILGQSTLDARRIIDWAINEHGASTDVVAGGVSMGGDIAVALAGLDQRVTRVAAVVATPDWTRPGMCEIGGSAAVIDQGQADTYAQWFYSHINPLTHLSGYAHAPAIAFECGADDTHVPADGALRFKEALTVAFPDAAGKVTVSVHSGLGHFAAAQDLGIADRCLAWLRGNDLPAA